MPNNIDPNNPKHLAKIPYDFRKPTLTRTKSRYWNATDRQFFTPKVYGAGWTVNCYWLVHPIRYFHNHRS